MGATNANLSLMSRLAGSYAPAFILVAAWLSLYVPVYFEYSQTAWTREENGHALFIMAICIGIAWVKLIDARPMSIASHKELFAGLFFLGAGLLVYFVGRTGQVDIFSSASQSMTAFAIVLCAFGMNGVRKLWFPLSLSFYLIIWPGWAIDAATGPLKRMISETVSDGLFVMGLPVAHSGAVISAGPYELLVADACAGLNSLIALTAIGAVYLYAAKRNSWKTNAAVIAALIPLAILANIIRVGLLVLITYFFGYDAGQSYLHEAAGLMMFTVALIGVFVVDAIAAFGWERHS